MAVLVLMYHRTPQEAGHLLDVTMSLFRAQVQGLQASGVRFISFSQALDRRWYTDDTVISITFDDGHRSNLEAMAFLHDAGVPSTSFFVTDFVRRGQDGFMDAVTFKKASALCEIGAHGATHTDLTSLRPEALKEELFASKAYLETLSGAQVTTMSAPGGRINRRVVSAALKLGFEVIGDSEPFLNASPRLPLHRVCMLNGQSPEYVLALVRAGPIYWLRKRLRRMVVSMTAQVLPQESFEALKRAFKSDPLQ